MAETAKRGFWTGPLAILNNAPFARNLVLIAAGCLAFAIFAAITLNHAIHPLKPAFQPAASPYAHAIYATGLIESDQDSGANMSLYPEVSGQVVRVVAHEGQVVEAGAPLVEINDEVQRQTNAQQKAQADAAAQLLAELKAEPRKETLEVAIAQLDQARANARTARDGADKVRKAFTLDPRSVSKDQLDNAEDTARAADEAAKVAERQLTLTRAGAWTYDIKNQEAQLAALQAAYLSGKALLDKYVIRAPRRAHVMAINAPLGGYVSSQGVYDPYTQATLPVAVLSSEGAGSGDGTLAVRAYVDEILLSRIPSAAGMKAEMVVRGADLHVPLTFVRIQPLVSPKIELSDARQERVDLRVLPVIFRFKPDPKARLYPGQLVDVYISQ